jgi:hypothetical protein
MNERIQELSKEAWRQVDVSKIRGRHAAYTKIFAKLVVRECANTASMFSIENKRIHPDVDPRNMPDANRMVYHSTCQGVSEEINRHFFGVSE